nr:nucleolar protein 12 [Pseudochaenichthys georgianus]
MKNLKKHNNNAKTGKFKPGSKKRENKCIVSFDANDRQDYLTGFHKRKVERRKVAVAEIKKKIKEEQIRVREERHKEYLSLLKERTDALEECEECEEDDLEDVITATTESVQYDHPNHTVTVTTISDLDLSGAHLLGPAETEGNEEGKEGGKEEGKKEGKEEDEELREERRPMPRKSGNPIMNKKIRSLNKSLTRFTAKKQKRKGRAIEKKSGSSEGKKKVTKRGKWQRRRLTGKKLHHPNE